MNKYETVFILTPVLSDDQMKETVEKFKKVLTDNGCTRELGTAQARISHREQEHWFLQPD